MCACRGGQTFEPTDSLEIRLEPFFWQLMLIHVYYIRIFLQKDKIMYILGNCHSLNKLKQLVSHTSSGQLCSAATLMTIRPILPNPLMAILGISLTLDLSHCCPLSDLTLSFSFSLSLLFSFSLFRPFDAPFPLVLHGFVLEKYENEM